MTTAAASTSHSAFVSKKFHSFVGVVPLGIYVLLHFSRNLTSLISPEAFDQAVLDSWKNPVSYLWTVLLVYIPLLFHSIYGAILVFKGTEKKNFFRFPNLPNLRYFFQRVSGLGVLGFLLAHIFLTRIHVLMGWLPGNGQVTYGYFATHMTDLSKGTAIVYALGILGVCYHLANGISTFCISWGITTGRNAMRKMEWISLGIGLLLLVMGYAIIVGFFLHDYTPVQVIGGPLLGH